MRDAESRFTGSVSPRGLLLLVLLPALSFLTVGSAAAAQFHPYRFSFDGSATTAGAFSDIEEVAVHQSTGIVYVLDHNNGVVDKFDAAGNPQNFSATGKSSLSVSEVCPGFQFQGSDDLAVDSSGGANDGRIYVDGYGSGGICAFEPSGALAWHLVPGSEGVEPAYGGACGLATDSAGRVWVGSGGNGALEFSAEGNPPTLIALVSEPDTCRLAIGSEGRIYLINNFGSRVNRFSVIGYQATIYEGGASSLAVDQSNQHIYVGQYNRVGEYLPDGTQVSETGAGTPFEQTGQGTLENASGVAVRSSTGDLYVSDRNRNQVYVYGPLGTFPDVTTGVSSGVSRTAAGLAGQLTSAGGPTTDCRFEWGTSTSYGNVNSCDQATPISGGSAVTASLTGLTPGTTYHYRLTAANSTGPNFGADMTFETPFVDGVSTGGASTISRAGATLNGSLEPNGIDAHYYFEWGTDPSYGNTAPLPPGTDAGSAAGPAAAVASISSLSVATTYHYRLVAQNTEGTTFGQDASFETLPAVVGIEPQAPTAISQTGLTLNSKLDPDGQDTHYYFEWGKTSSYGTTTTAPPGQDIGSAPGSTTVSATLTGLDSPGEYHYRLVASNSYGTTYGPDEIASTLPPLLPGISDSAASDVTATTATFAASIDPGFGSTIYRFQYGPTTDYEFSTVAGSPLDADNTFHAVSSRVEELTPGTTYHYRAVGINYSGVTHGPDQTFATPGPPLISGVSSDEPTATAARVHVAINPDGRPTSYRVEYGLGSGYGSATQDLSIGDDHVDHPLTVTLTGLQSGSSYHYRVVASNEIGSGESGDQVFSTVPEPPVLFTPTPAQRCKKGFVKRHGKCVKKHGHRRRKAHGNQAHR